MTTIKEWGDEVSRMPLQKAKECLAAIDTLFSWPFFADAYKMNGLEIIRAQLRLKIKKYNTEERTL